MSVGKSVNGGVTWTHQQISGPSAYLYSMAVDPAHPDTVYAGGYESPGSAIYRTLNGGTSWTRLTTTVMTNYVYGMAVSPVNPSVIFAATGGGIYRSADFGSTWVKVSSTIGGCKDVLINPGNPNWVWVSTSSQGIYQSTDGGTTWAAMNGGLGDLCVNKLAINPGNYLFAGTDGAAAYRWSLSVGVGETETAPVVLPALCASPNPVETGATIHYTVTGSTPAALAIYDMQGRLVRTLSGLDQTPGDHEAWWDGADPSGNPVASGVYFLRMVSGAGIQTGRMVVTR
jgi:hypothetical protein